MKKPADWTRLKPGFYRDAQGSIHVLVEEILEELGCPNTEVNRDRCFELLERAAKNMYPSIPLVKSDSLDSWLSQGN